MSKLRPRTEIGKRLILMVLSLAFILFIAEISVQILKPLHQLEYVADEEVYWRFKPNQFVKGPPMESVNDQGFRGTRNVEPKDDRVRIFVLGDSYTWGSGLSDNETMPAQLEAMSEGQHEVINGGMPGWGIFQMEICLRRWIDDLNPDVVVVVFSVGDIYRQPFASEHERAAYLRQAKMRNRVRKYSMLATVTVRAIERLKLTGKKQSTINAFPYPEDNEEVPSPTFLGCWAQDKERLRNIKRMANEHGSEFLIFVWPQKGRTNAWFMEESARFCTELGVPVIDLASTLARHAWDEYSLPRDHHPSAFGQQLAARELYSYLAPLTEGRREGTVTK